MDITYRVPRGVTRDEFRDFQYGPGLAEGAGRKALREELSSVVTLAEYNRNYRCWPYTDDEGKTVFTVGTITVGATPTICKLFEVKNLSSVRELADLYAAYPDAWLTGSPFITHDRSVIVSTLNGPGGLAQTMMVLRYADGVLSNVYEDTGTNVSHVYYFGQGIRVHSEATKAIYGGYGGVFAGVSRSRVIKSVDDGRTWTLVYDVAEANPTMYDAWSHETPVFNIVCVSNRDAGTIVRSTDGGTTWTEIAIGLVSGRFLFAPLYGQPGDIGTLFLGGGSCRLYVSYDRGASWPLTIRAATSENNIGDLNFIGGYAVCSVRSRPGQILLSKDYFNTIVPFQYVKEAVPRFSGFFDVMFVGGEGSGKLHRIRLPPSLHRGYSSEVVLWANQSVLAAGANTEPLYTYANEAVTICLHSDQNGDLTIQTYQPDLAAWVVFDTVVVVANTLVPYKTTHKNPQIRLNFVPDVDATVTAWAMFDQ